MLIWGLGIGDLGLGPIPNPQSPFKIIYFDTQIKYILYFINLMV